MFRWKTFSSDQILETKEHQTSINLSKTLDKDSCHIDIDELEEWITDHADVVMEYLKAIQYKRIKWK